MATELVSASEGGQTVSTGERLTLIKLRLPVGTPVALAYTDACVFLHGKKIGGRRTDLVHLAQARAVSGAEIELLFVSDPPSRYRLKLADAATAVAVVNELTYLRRARLALQTGEHRALFLLQEGDVFSRLGEYDRAGTAYKNGAEMDVPEHSGTGALNYAIILRKGGREDDAARYFTQALDIGSDPAAGQAALNLGLMCAVDGDTDGARRYFERAKLLGHELADSALRRLEA